MSEPEPFEDLLVITNQTENLVKVREFVTHNVRRSAVRKQDENKIKLAVDEAVSNIMEHAYEESREGTIELHIEGDASRLVIVIRDSGKHFDPGEIAPIDIREHVKAGKRHGLGIFIMRQIMDEVEYRYKEGKHNELRLVKYTRSGGGTEGRPQSGKSPD